MEASVSSRLFIASPNFSTNLSRTAPITVRPKSETRRTGSNHLNRRRRRSAAAVNEVSAAAADPAQIEVGWQIIVGSIAGVTPFVVAGIEFTKRIIAQKRCEICGGSGLILEEEEDYYRCPGCGGFLPWQSWKRFFSG